MQANKGFYINDTTPVNRISGPVSMNLLVPNFGSNFVSRYPNAPIFMLFGDVHRSTVGLCGEAPGTYPVYKIDFLKKLNQILADGESIDFYTEGTDVTDHQYDKEEHTEPLMAIYDLVAKCNKLKADKGEEYQAINKITWHHTDIRFWDHTSPQAEEMKTQMKSNANKILTIPQLLNTIKRHDYFLENRNADGFAMVFVAHTLSLKAQEYKISLQFQTKNTEIFPDLIMNPFSFIAYQIKQIQDASLRRIFIDASRLYIEYQVDKITKKLTDAFHKLDLDEELIPLFHNVHQRLFLCFNSITQENKISKLAELAKIYDEGLFQTYQHFMLDFEVMQLDLFTLAKSFTRMSQPGGMRPMINICYFGDYHIEGMVYFLTEILDKAYDKPLSLPAQQKGDEYNRCLDLTKIERVSLADLLSVMRERRGGRRTRSRTKHRKK
jgi:hypothetical protein